MSKSITLTLLDEVYQKYSESLAAAKAANPELTNGKWFADLLETSTAPGEAPEIDLKDYISISDHREIMQGIETFKNELISMLNLKEDATIFEIQDEIKATQQRAMMALKDNDDNAPAVRSLAENEICFEIPEPQLMILKTTAERLSVKLGKTVTLRDLFIDVPFRYVVQMYNQWFFPFVIKPEEFEKLCGTSHKNLLLWLNKKPEA